MASLRECSSRKFIRHPADIPISLEKCDDRYDIAAEAEQPVVQNVSCGGICCLSKLPHATGERVKLKIDTVQPAFDVVGEVMWCQYTALGYEIGLRFLNTEDAYAARMVEQVCHIEHHRRRVLSEEGRLLTGEEAALEWISRYAPDFPELDANSESSSTDGHTKH